MLRIDQKQKTSQGIGQHYFWSQINNMVVASNLQDTFKQADNQKEDKNIFT